MEQNFFSKQWNERPLYSSLLKSINLHIENSDKIQNQGSRNKVCPNP